MKAFDKWYGDYLDVAGDEIYTAEERMESAFRAGMLAAAEISDNFKRPMPTANEIGPNATVVYEWHRAIAKQIRREANTD